eukprot:Awhi_evm2s1539
MEIETETEVDSNDNNMNRTKSSPSKKRKHNRGTKKPTGKGKKIVHETNVNIKPSSSSSLSIGEKKALLCTEETEPLNGNTEIDIDSQNVSKTKSSSPKQKKVHQEKIDKNTCTIVKDIDTKEVGNYVEDNVSLADAESDYGTRPFKKKEELRKKSGGENPCASGDDVSHSKTSNDNDGDDDKDNTMDNSNIDIILDNETTNNNNHNHNNKRTSKMRETKNQKQIEGHSHENQKESFSIDHAISVNERLLNPKRIKTVDSNENDNVNNNDKDQNNDADAIAPKEAVTDNNVKLDTSTLNFFNVDIRGLNLENESVIQDQAPIIEEIRKTLDFEYSQTSTVGGIESKKTEEKTNTKKKTKTNAKTKKKVVSQNKTDNENDNMNYNEPGSTTKNDNDDNDDDNDDNDNDNVDDFFTDKEYSRPKRERKPCAEWWCFETSVIGNFDSQRQLQRQELVQKGLLKESDIKKEKSVPRKRPSVSSRPKGGIAKKKSTTVNSTKSDQIGKSALKAKPIKKEPKPRKPPAVKKESAKNSKKNKSTTLSKSAAKVSKKAKTSTKTTKSQITKKDSSSCASVPQSNGIIKDLTNEDSTWTDIEQKRLANAVVSIPKVPIYWSLVAKRVGTKSAIECELEHCRLAKIGTSNVPEKVGENVKNKKDSVDQEIAVVDVALPSKKVAAKKALPKGKAKKSGGAATTKRKAPIKKKKQPTLKEKKLLRKQLDEMNENHEDDLFESTPFRQTKKTRTSNNNDSIGNHMDSEFVPPLPTKTVTKNPTGDKKISDSFVSKASVTANSSSRRYSFGCNIDLDTSIEEYTPRPKTKFNKHLCDNDGGGDDDDDSDTEDERLLLRPTENRRMNDNYIGNLKKNLKKKTGIILTDETLNENENSNAMSEPLVDFSTSGRSRQGKRLRGGRYAQHYDSQKELEEINKKAERKLKEVSDDDDDYFYQS